MNFRIKTLWLSGSAAFVAGTLLIGCASEKPKAPVQPVAEQPAPEPESRPGVTEEDKVVVTAKVQAINKKKRIVTLKFPDGRTAKIKCGPEVRNFAQIQVGDDVMAEFRETVELFVADQPSPPGAESAGMVKRAPKGKKPAATIVQAVEAKVTVDAIDYAARKVTLKGPEGNKTTVHVGPEVKRLNEVKAGDTVVARYIEAVAIEVTTPEKTELK